MKRRWIISFVLLIVAGLIFVFVPPQREPSYDGKTLSEWIKRSHYLYPLSPPYISVEQSLEFFETRPEWQECRVAFQAMKKEALPILDEWVQAKDSTFKQELKAFGIPVGNGPSAYGFHLWAAQGFLMLGADAEPSIPLLLKMTEDKDYERKIYGMVCLRLIRPPKNILFPVLTRLLRDSDPEISEKAAQFILSLYQDEAKTLKICEQFPNLCDTNGVSRVH
ncbi:MAG: hypothetical protein JWM68_1493 [Verrucomicrobiales bacterium]|nr:hypothetical protein [Verrucomicrobiales bacterium]